MRKVECVAAGAWRKSASLTVLLSLGGPCLGAEEAAAARVPVPPPAVPAASAAALDLLEYLGTLQHDDQGWYGPEDIADPRAAPPQSAARADAQPEATKQ